MSEKLPQFSRSEHSTVCIIVHILTFSFFSQKKLYVEISEKPSSRTALKQVRNSQRGINNITQLRTQEKVLTQAKQSR